MYLRNIELLKFFIFDEIPTQLSSPFIAKIAFIEKIFTDMQYQLGVILDIHSIQIYDPTTRYGWLLDSSTATFQPIFSRFQYDRIILDNIKIIEKIEEIDTPEEKRIVKSSNSGKMYGV